ncbi:MAG: 23S rRNA pseudouridine1911/1915/1917 synthase, partial [Candidatus Krumholzibacteriia bacterium]
MSISVIYEDNHLLVLDKPAGLLAQGDHSGAETVVDVAAAYLKQKYSKPGNVYVGLVHRLDRNVSGVMVIARTSKAAARLSEQFRTKAV